MKYLPILILLGVVLACAGGNRPQTTATPAPTVSKNRVGDNLEGLTPAQQLAKRQQIADGLHGSDAVVSKLAGPRKDVLRLTRALFLQKHIDQFMSVLDTNKLRKMGFIRVEFHSALDKKVWKIDV